MNKFFLFYKKNKKRMSYFFSFLFFFILLYYIILNIQDFSKLAIENYSFIFLLVFLVIIRIFITGRIMDLSVRPLGIELNILESFGLANLTRLMNQILPGKAGVIMRSVYLKNKYGLPYASFASSFSASQLVLFLASSIIGLISIFLLKIFGTEIPIFFSYLLLFILCSVIFTLTFSDKLLFKIKNDFLLKTLSSWRIIKNNKMTVNLLFFWSIMFSLTSALILFSMFNAFGAEISLLIALFFGSINIVNSFISITPAGFGTSEGILSALAYSVGIDIPTALTAALLLRAVTFFSVLIISPFVSKKLFNSSLRVLFLRKFTNKPLNFSIEDSYYSK